MAKNLNVSTERVIIAAVVLAVAVFVLLQMRPFPPQSSLSKQTQETKQEQTYSNFLTWQKQSTVQLPFRFYLPDSLELKTQADNQFQVISHSQSEKKLFDLTMLSYPDFQKEKSTMDESGEKQFGWTNAYGESVLEYENIDGTPRMIVYVVAIDKHDVMKFSTDSEESHNLIKNITRTVQRTELDRYQEVRIVNYVDNYFVKIPASLIQQPEKGVNPFEPTVVSLDTKKKNGEHDLISVLNISKGGREFIDMIEGRSKTYSNEASDYSLVNTISKDGMKGVVYRVKSHPVGDAKPSTENSFGAVFEKDNKFFIMELTEAEGPREYEMTQAINSFRFLTDQEQMH